jgi:hypothetical protein
MVALHLNEQPAPNLQITSVKGPSTSKVGSCILVSCSLNNSGYEAAKRVKVGIYLSTDSTISPSQDRRLGTLPLPRVEVQSALTREMIVRIPIDVLPREYYLGAFVDAENRLTKVNETYNQRASNRTIRILPDESLPAVRWKTWRNPVFHPSLSFVLPRL